MTSRDAEPAVSAPALLALALHAARAGAFELTSRSGNVTGVEYKSTATDPVSDADRAAEAAIVAVLTSARPQDGLFGEEGAERSGHSGFRWAIDPLDGTVNYLYDTPHWSVSVGCERAVAGGWEAVAGVVLDPARSEEFTATAGGGAQLNGERLQVNDPIGLEAALIHTGFSYRPASRTRQAAVVATLLPLARDIRRTGSAALDLCWLAAGRCDGYYEDELNRWDWAAGALIARESGAVVSQLGGGLVASGPWLHPRLREVVSPQRA